MNRRAILQALLGLSAVPVLPAGAQQMEAGPKIPLTAADAVAEGLPRFFSPEESAAFRHLASLLMPAFDGRPGAIEAEAPDFLDFLLGISPADAQQLYRSGVRRLNMEAQKRYQRPFVKLDATQAAAVLEPLRAPWTYGELQDTYARFLAAAKVAFYQATVNSRQWAGSSRSRAAAGIGSYWLPIE